MACKFVDIGFELYQFFAEIVAHIAQDMRVDLDAFEFHLRDDRDERALDGFVDGSHFFGGEAGLERFIKTQCDFGIFGGVIYGIWNGDLIEGDFVFALSSDIFVFDGAVLEIFFTQEIHAVAVG